MANNGWISIHRQIEDSAIWTGPEAFDKRSAWIDLILMANHEDREIVVNGCPLLVKRGQKFTSVRQLAEKWHWSRDKVTRYLNMLVRLNMCVKDMTHNGTLLTLVKYDDFQVGHDTKRDANKATGKATVKPSTGRRQGTNNKVNNVNNVNNETSNTPPAVLLDPEGNPLQ